ncbi:MAG: LPS export ABC transporter periplasmic protein LptC [Comamonadaceae bacterium]|nr:LPS export ABC transporter periplasmic protein LptC [Burkholderiales bacterium]MEB2347895.1 LPS export ABC transporter periplasmic protein LptC [Comamonadaceae bacterium]
MNAPLLRRAWERTTLYLPLALMGLLALGTWWLVRNAPATPQVTPPPAVEHVADYFMRDFAVKSFDAAGQLQSTVRGQIAHHYPDTDTLEVQQVAVRSTDREGRVTTATADRAISNADGSEVQLIGNAVVTRTAPARPDRPPQPPMRFEGEYLHAWVNDERVRSDQRVTLIQGGDRVSADSLDYDNKAQILEMRGNVRGLVEPAAARRAR